MDDGFDEIEPELNELSGAVIGAAIEVHRRLGPGLDEALYEAAMAIELSLRGIDFVRQKAIAVNYKGKPIGEKRLDLVVRNKIIVELKAVEQLSNLHKAQLLTYLRITGLRLGILINFNTAILKDGIKRVIAY